MILLADSGSTKTHWLLMTANGHAQSYFTSGINPVHQPQQLIRANIDTELLPQLGKQLWAGTLTHVFFYGAGCTPTHIPLMQELLHSVFRHATIQVASDMLGAARSLLAHQPGVACILGTGSASCYYDGSQIARTIPSLGYILGDEGSGAVLGKKLLNRLYKHPQWQELLSAFVQAYSLDLPGVIEQVYRQPNPNRTLAAWSRFCAQHSEHPLIQQLLHEHFEEFIVANIEPYFTSDIPRTLACVGGIAYQYQEQLRAVAQQHHIALTAVLQDPIDGLRAYHQTDVQPTM